MGGGDLFFLIRGQRDINNVRNNIINDVIIRGRRDINNVTNNIINNVIMHITNNVVIHIRTGLYL